MNFFKNLSHYRLVINLYGQQVSRSLKTCKTIKSGLQCTNFFLADFVFTSECPHYSQALYSTCIFTCTTQQKIHLHFS